MTSRSLRKFKHLSYLILFFFCWTNLGIYNIAYAAAKGSDQGSVASGQQKTKSPEEKFQEALEKIREAEERADEKLGRAEDVEVEEDEVKKEKGEIETLDVEIKKELKETEDRIKDLPEEVKQRHRDFAKKYEENLKELKTDLDDIEKAKTKTEKEQAHKKTKDFLEKTKPPKKHTPLDPDILPNENRELKPLQTSWLDKISDLLFPSAYAAEPPLPNSADLAETLETPLNQEIHDIAANIGGTPVNLYEFVRNNFQYEPYAGSVKGAIQTLKEKGGNEWDLASLLIAFYRASGIPARYVVGTVEIPSDRVMSWLGVEDARMAASLLLTQGRPTNVIISGGKVTAIRFQHVWVQAYVPFLYSRGATSGQGDTWIDIDPSFKLQKVNQTINLTGQPDFNQKDYLSTFRTESPYDYHRNQVQAFLDANSPGYVPEAISRNLEIETEYLGILIGQVPYTVKSIIATYTEIPDSYRQKFTVTITDSFTGEATLSYTASLPQIIGKRLTLSYVPATTSDEATIAAYGDIFSTPPYLIKLKPQIKLEGQTVAEGTPIGSGETQPLEFVFNTTFDTGRVQNTIIAGGYYAIGLNAQKGSGSHEEILERSQKLASITDTIKFNDPATLDDRLGELLHLSAMVYHQNLNMAIKKIAPLHKVVDIREVSEMMYFLAVKVDYLFGVPRKIAPAGITADADRDIHLVVPMDGDMGRIKPYMQLESTNSSYLEHYVTGKAYQTETISAVKAIQLAYNQGIPVYTITNQNISTVLPLLTVSSEIKTDISNAVNAGQEVVVPERNITLGDWTGVGYIIQDPTKGSGAYLISGGYGGAAMIYEAYIRDLLTIPMSSFSSQLRSCTVAQAICFPGLDNIFGTSDDNCYTEIAMEDIQEDCGLNDPGCQKKYAYYVKRDGFVRPLIDIMEHPQKTGAFLTKHISVWHWQSQEGARYMRASTAVLTAIEQMMEYFGAVEHELRPTGAGYRTVTRNLSIGGSPSSHHPDGTAADTRLERQNNVPVKKCEVLGTADYMIGGRGEVLAERDKYGNPKTTVHISIPGKNNRDGNDKAQWKCP